jgi:exosortase/archaeosortase family protein
VTRSRVSRELTAIALAAAAVLLLVFQATFRGWEASWGAALYGVLTPTAADGRDAVVYFGLGRLGGFGLRITAECSAAFLIAPVALVAAVIARQKRVPLGRVLGALGLTALLLVFGNLIRVGVIALLIKQLGLDEGYGIGHTVAGTLVSVAFIASAIALFVWITAAGRTLVTQTVV